MKILSIDVGIRNLSFCLFEIEDSDKTKIEIIIGVPPENVNIYAIFYISKNFLVTDNAEK